MHFAWDLGRTEMCNELKPETLVGYPWVRQNMGKRGTKRERLQNISIDPYFAHNSAFPKWLQANLAYIAHP